MFSTMLGLIREIHECLNVACNDVGDHVGNSTAIFVPRCSDSFDYKILASHEPFADGATQESWFHALFFVHSPKSLLCS